MATMQTADLDGTHWLAILLAAVTGAIHLYMGVVQQGLTPMGISFIVAGLGFAGGIVLFLLDVRRQLLYPLGVLFTGGQVVLYVPLNWPDIFFTLGVVDKTVQVVLIGVLVVLYRREA